jgi:hypothetical protein
MEKAEKTEESANYDESKELSKQPSEAGPG